MFAAAAVTVACSSDDDGTPSMAQDAGPHCPATQTACGAACADLQSNREHCGRCGAACIGAQVCVAGKCEATCPSGSAACFGTCVDTQTDNFNCGACGTVCTASNVCNAGKCDTVCGGGLTLCTAEKPYCASTKTDPKNCGTCGKTCGVGEVCDNGTCASSCTAPLALCGGKCADTANDPAHCGGCDKPACAAPTNGVAVCAQGACAFVCRKGFADCDAKVDTGCETPVDTAANCGSCGHACPAAPDHATMACTSGECGAVCDSGFTLSDNECVFKVTFPSATSTRTCTGTDADGGAVCSRAGDAIAESFAYPAANSVTSLTYSFDMTDATSGCAADQTLSWDVLVNGTTVGSFSFAGGSGSTARTVSGSFAFPAIAPDGGNFTLRVQSSTDVCDGGGSWDWVTGGTAVLE